MPKRKDGHNGQDVVSKALRVKGATDKAAFELLQIGQSASSVPSSLSSFRNKVSAELPAHLIQRVPLNKNKKDQELYLPVTNLKALLQERIQHVPAYGAALEEAVLTKHGSPLELVIYFDEAQAGNILAPSSNKKLLFGYGAFVELGLQEESLWFDLMSFSHGSIDEVHGGWSRLFKVFLLKLHSFGIESGFALQRPGGHPFWVQIAVSAITGDFDALRCLYDWRGAASIKLCLLCKNMVSKSSELNQFNSYLKDQTHAGLSGCDMWSDQQISDLWDMPKAAPALSQAQKERNEKVAGFNIYNFQSLLADSVARDIAPLSKVFFDPMHLYYSKGMASWEIVQFVERMQSHGLTLAILSEAMRKGDWRADCTSSRPSWYRGLLDPRRFNTDAYKGSASDLKALLPIFFFHLKESAQGVLGPELRSLEALLKIHNCLHDLRSRGPNSHSVGLLQQFQEEHRGLYILAYGEAALKPKHHLRFHLPDMMMKHKHYCDCFPMEAKHQAFKYAVQNKLDGQLGNLAVYSDKVLQRLLILAETTLQAKLWPGSLEAEKQCKRAGFVDGFEGKSLVCQHGRIRVNDFVITDDAIGLVEACLRNRSSDLFLLMRRYHLATCLPYKLCFRHRFSFLRLVSLRPFGPPPKFLCGETF